MKNSFIFYKSFSDAIDSLPEAEQLQVYRAIKEYALNGVEIELGGIAKGFFTLIKPQIDANNKKYENGAKGGRPNKDRTKSGQDIGLFQTVTEPEPRDNLDVTEPEPTDPAI
jgi:hypothetical protein